MPASAKVVDMTKVKERSFNTKHLPEGDYRAKVAKVEDHKSKAGNDQWLYTITITDDRGKGATYPVYCGQDPDQLWKVRNLFVAAGINVPKKKLKLDPNKVVGRAVGVTLEDDEYEGKPKSVIAAFIPVSEVGDADEDASEDDEEVDEETEDDEDSDDSSDDEFDGMDRAELKAYITERDSDFKAKKSQSDDDLREIARGLGNSSEDDEEDEDEDEEEAPPPKNTKGKKGKKATPEVSDDELEELEIEEI